MVKLSPLILETLKFLIDSKLNKFTFWNSKNYKLKLIHEFVMVTFLTITYTTSANSNNFISIKSKFFAVIFSTVIICASSPLIIDAPPPAKIN